jgi:hypothetical protein
MPQFNFKKRFADMVEAGLKIQTTAPPGTASTIIKRQTIRAKRKDGRNPHVGDTLYLFVAQRTKGCRRLGETICKEVHQITIDWHGINIDGGWLLNADKQDLAVADGFNDFYEMKEFFRKEHGLPFEGLLYKW